MHAPHVDPLNPAILDRCAKVWVDEASKRGRVNLYYADRLERWETIAPLVDMSGRASMLPQRGIEGMHNRIRGVKKGSVKIKDNGVHVGKRGDQGHKRLRVQL